MGSGIALLPASLAKIGSVAIWGWIIAAIGALSLAYVLLVWQLITHKQVGLLRMLEKLLQYSGIRHPFFIIMQTGLVI